MTIYHGSQDKILAPIFGQGKPYNDYGLGFYCTENLELAKEWACAVGKDGYANKYDLDNPRYLSGMSGKEMADMLIESSVDTNSKRISSNTYHVSPEYWAGWVMAYYQWYTAKSFCQMYADGQTYEKVLMMYHPMHEADLAKVVEMMG